MMKHVLVLGILGILGMCVVGQDQPFPDPSLNFSSYVSALGYPVETHEITTSDGYILTYFRLQAKNTTIKDGLEVVYWQHGLVDSSDLTMINYEPDAPTLILANEGFDVWVGNSRGNTYSKKNLYYTPNQKEFWQFTWQDMAMKDLPAAFEYITNYTQKQKINYIGHSQGTMIMHAALALNITSVVTKVNHVISTGPVAFVSNINSLLIKKTASIKSLFYILNQLGIWEFLPASKGLYDTDAAVCKKAPYICDEILRLTADLMPSVDNLTRWDYFTRHFPCGTSLLNIHHWQQLVESDRFQLYDYGRIGNNREYGQPTPPVLDLSKITQPVHLFAGDTDELADPVDVIRLWNSLTNSQGKTLHMYHMGHLSFMLGKNMEYLQDVLKILKSN